MKRLPLKTLFILLFTLSCMAFTTTGCGDENEQLPPLIEQNEQKDDEQKDDEQKDDEQKDDEQKDDEQKDDEQKDDEQINPDGKSHYSTAKEIALKSSDFSAKSQAEQLAWSAAVNTFGMTLEKEAVAADQNSILSAYSIHSALSMMAYGARGETKQEMDSVLGLNTDADVAAELHGTMRSQLRFDGQHEDSLFTIANRLWAEQSLTYKQPFVDALKNHYLAELQLVNFKEQSAALVPIINQFVENNTDGMIKKLVTKQDITPMTNFVLVNAIYFNGKWEHEFAKMDDQMTFHNLDGTEAQIAQMQHHGEIKTAELKDLKSRAIRLDYKQNKYHMLLVVPDSNDDFASLQNLTHAQLLDIESQIKPEMNAILNMPKVRIESSFTEMSDNLQNIGIKLAFDHPDTDFTGITSTEDGKNIIAISKVIHKAVIEWNEIGTKAAAATGIIGNYSSIAPLTIDLDKAFRFFIVHDQSNVVIFSGQFVKASTPEIM